MMVTVRTGALLALISAASYAVTITTYSALRGGWRPHRVETAWIAFGLLLAAWLAVCALRRDGGTSETPAGESSAAPWIVAAAMVVAALVYRPALGIGWLSDDFVLLDLARAGDGLALGYASFFRPAPLLAYRAAGALPPSIAAPAFHAALVALHLACGLLVWRVGAALRLPPAAAASGAALFLLFPASTEAVAWCAGIPDVLAAFGALAFVLAALHGRIWPLAPALVLALLAKETAVAAPVLAALLLIARREPVPRRIVAAVAAAALAAALFAAWRIGAAEASFLAVPTRYFVKQILSVTFGTLAAPWRGDTLRAVPAVAAFAAVVSAAAAIGLARSGARSPRAAAIALALLAWVAVAVAPVYSMLFVSRDLEGGRYLYLASAGWGLLLAAGLLAWRGRARTAGAAALALVAVLWTWGALDRVADWTAAAASRDAALASATTAASGCDRVVLDGRPDAVRGAYVFRNGLREALARRGVAVADPADAAACVLEWNGSAYARADR